MGSSSPLPPITVRSEDMITILLNIFYLERKEIESDNSNNTTTSRKTVSLKNLIENVQELRCNFGYDHPSIPELLHEIRRNFKKRKNMECYQAGKNRFDDDYSCFEFYFYTEQ